jgi:hypothetical protein
VIQELEVYPGRGWKLLEAALRSESPLEYIPALRVLGSWDTRAWPDEAPMALKQMLRRQLQFGSGDLVLRLLDQT